jgi:hypothetical protein
LPLLKFAIAIEATPFEVGFELFREAIVGDGFQVPGGILVNTQLLVDVAEDILVGAVNDGEGKLKLDLE